MTQSNRYRPILLAVVVVLALVAGAGVATATHTDSSDESDSSDWFGDGVGDDASMLDRAIERVAKSLSQATKGAAKAKAMNPLADDPPTAEENARDALEVFNANNDTARVWANTHLPGDADHQVFEVQFSDRDDGAYSIYVVADYSTGQEEYVSAEAVDEEQFSSMDREVDATIEFGWYASENADSELEEWVDRFGEDNESMTSKYRANMLRKYADDVEHDLV